MRRFLPLAVLVLVLVAAPALGLERENDAPQNATSRLSLGEHVSIVLTDLWDKYLGQLEPFGDEGSEPESARLPMAEAVPTPDAEDENSTGP